MSDTSASPVEPGRPAAASKAPAEESGKPWLLIFSAVISLIVAIVAGVFLGWWNLKEPHLSYAEADGPAVEVGGAYRRMYELKVTNTGRAEAENVLVQIISHSGKVDAGDFSTSPGVEAAKDEESNAYGARIASLNPDDYVRVAAQLSQPSALAAPIVVVRAKGVNGVEEESRSTPWAWFVVLQAISDIIVVGALVGLYVAHRSGRKISKEMDDSRKEAERFTEKAESYLREGELLDAKINGKLQGLEALLESTIRATAPAHDSRGIQTSDTVTDAANDQTGKAPASDSMNPELVQLDREQEQSKRSVGGASGNAPEIIYRLAQEQTRDTDSLDAALKRAPEIPGQPAQGNKRRRRPGPAKA